MDPVKSSARESQAPIDAGAEIITVGNTGFMGPLTALVVFVAKAQPLQFVPSGQCAFNTEGNNVTLSPMVSPSPARKWICKWAASGDHRQLAFEAFVNSSNRLHRNTRLMR